MDTAARLDTAPWFAPIDPFPSEPAGLLWLEEAQLFHNLTKSYWSGGAVIDAGSFLGRSAFFFAQGMRRSPHFDPVRSRVHCYDNFIVNDAMTSAFVRQHFGQDLAVGKSTRAIFDTQTESVRDLLVVHEGDFHTADWHSQPIDILMVDIAKSPTLGSRVVELFFRDLVPGRSIVAHQDYHHVWLPHIHVVMESFGDSFEIVAPKVGDTTVFLLVAALKETAVRRAVAYDFSAAERRVLMDRAVERFPLQLRGTVELARVKLLTDIDVQAAFSELERTVARHSWNSDPTWARQVAQMRTFIEERDAWRALTDRDLDRAKVRAESIVAAGSRTSTVCRLLAAIAEAQGARDEAEALLHEGLALEPSDPWVATQLSHLLARQSRIDGAEMILVRSMLAGAASGTACAGAADHLMALWQQRLPGTLPRARTQMDLLRRKLPEHPEVLALEARLRFACGHRDEAAAAMRRACARGLPAKRADALLAPAGITREQLLGGMDGQRCAT